MSTSLRRDLILHKQVSLLLWRLMPKAMKELQKELQRQRALAPATC